MKKVLASVILVVFLFNVLGYYCVYFGMRFFANRALTEKIASEEYADHEVIVLKIPFSLPYHPGNITFERHDNEIQHHGEFYRIVKRNLERDTLYTVYIKDHRSSSLLRSLVSFVKSHSDMPVSKNAAKLTKGTYMDFLVFTSALQNASAGWSYSEKYPSQDYFLSFFDSPVFSPPPES